MAAIAGTRGDWMPPHQPPPASRDVLQGFGTLLSLNPATGGQAAPHNDKGCPHQVE